MQGAEHDEPEMSFRRGYQQGVIELFFAIERFLDPATREVVQAWIEKDVYIWRVNRPLPALRDLCWRWPSRLVATAAEDRLNIPPSSDSVCGSHALRCVLIVVIDVVG